MKSSFAILSIHPLVLMAAGDWQTYCLAACLSSQTSQVPFPTQISFSVPLGSPLGFSRLSLFEPAAPTPFVPFVV
jgi:hypothetical protein